MGLFQKIAKLIGHSCTKREVRNLVAKIESLPEDVAIPLFQTISDMRKLQEYFPEPYNEIFGVILTGTEKNQLNKERRESLATLLHHFIAAQKASNTIFDRWALYTWRVTTLTMLDESLYSCGLKVWDSIDNKANEIDMQGWKSCRPQYFK